MKINLRKIENIGIGDIVICERNTCLLGSDIDGALYLVDIENANVDKTGYDVEELDNLINEFGLKLVAKGKEVAVVESR